MASTGSARRTLVGTMLRQYREARGFDLREAARILSCDPSKVSRIETGERGIRDEDLSKLLREYGVAGAARDTLAAICLPRGGDGWWQHYRKVVPDPQMDFIITEGVASRVMVYAPLRVPELLCTAGYARAMAEADVAVPEGMEDDRVQAVVDHRQAVLFGRKPEVTVILGEAALRQQVGGPVVMGKQFGRLKAVSRGNAWLNIRILPFSAGATAGGDIGAFSLLQFDDLPEVGVAHLAGPGGGLYTDDAALIAAYAKTFSHLGWYAMTREQSLVRFAELAAR